MFTNPPKRKYEPEARSHWDSMTSKVDGQLTALSNLVKTLKDDGVWGDFTCFNVCAGSVADTLKPLVGSVDTVSNSSPSIAASGALQVGNGVGLAWDASLDNLVDSDLGTLGIYNRTGFSVNANEEFFGVARFLSVIILEGRVDWSGSQWFGEWFFSSTTLSGSSVGSVDADECVFLANTGSLVAFSINGTGYNGVDSPPAGSTTTVTKSGIVGRYWRDSRVTPNTEGYDHIPAANFEVYGWWASDQDIRTESGNSGIIRSAIGDYNSVMGIS